MMIVIVMMIALYTDDDDRHRDDDCIVHRWWWSSSWWWSTLLDCIRCGKFCSGRTDEQGDSRSRMLQNVIMICWKPFNAECLFFVVHLEQHLILPVFHLLERLVLAIIQVLLTDTFSMLICEDYNMSPCWRCWLSIPLRIYTPRGPPPSSLITTLDWFGWWEHYHCSQN